MTPPWWPLAWGQGEAVVWVPGGSVGAGLHSEFTFTSLSRVSHGREGRVCQFLLGLVQKNQTAKAGIQPLTPRSHRDPIRLPSPPTFLHRAVKGAIVKLELGPERVEGGVKAAGLLLP